eukprot:gnl/Spiro4/8700_TR4551_c0_g1_i1.p1 gnl/Spiro4/8700_TR4551_c0_g1~~gnl/Spiro4/8700_TR4551_c0_g1_i1.p1  ORF type:complete len:310 (+),score=96.68 gnl/Spiro4/8700_TR4551_c0_g1_i1:41-970(+)
MAATSEVVPSSQTNEGSKEEGLHFTADASAPPSLVQIHPVVLLSILDHHTRRAEQSGRVIGTLLGFAHDGTIEVRDSFPVPCQENSEQVALDMNFLHSLHELHQRINRKEQIIGWYATGPAVDINSTLIHGFYDNLCRVVTQPVHLHLDTSLSHHRLSVRSFISSAVELSDNDDPTKQFCEIASEIKMSESERIGVDTLIAARHNRGATLQSASLLSDLKSLDDGFARLESAMDSAITYVDSVVKGDAPGNETIGRFLFDTIRSVPHTDPDAFQSMFQDSVNDVLMVVYLANLTRTQLALAEKLYAVVA